MQAMTEEPVMITVNTMRPRWGVGRTKTYELIKSGDIETRLIGGQRLIVDDSVRRLFNLTEAA